MSILFIEGFETLGTQIGLGTDPSFPTSELTAITNRLKSRMLANNSVDWSTSPGESYMFLREGVRSLYCWDMGLQPQNYIRYTLPEELQQATGPESPTIAVGAYVFNPLTPDTYTLFTCNYSSILDPNIQVVDGRHLRVRYGDVVLQQVDNVFVPNGWQYVEWKFRLDNNTSLTGVAQVATAPMEGDASIALKNIVIQPRIWKSNTGFSIGNITQYKGTAYEALIAGSNKIPDANPTYWAPLGPASGYTSATVPSFSRFYFEGTPGNQFQANTSGTTVNLNKQIKASELGGSLPEVDDYVYFGARGEYEIAVNGITVLSQEECQTIYDFGPGTLQNINFHNSTKGKLGGGSVRYDDIYILHDDGLSNSDLLGPVTVIGLKPNADDSDDWEPSSDVAHYTLVSPPSTASTYVSSDDPDNVDSYQCANLSANDPVYALQAHCRARCETAGDPTLTVAIVSGSSQDQKVQQFDGVTADTLGTGVTLVSNQNPDSSTAWTRTSVNAAKISIQTGNYPGV